MLRYKKDLEVLGWEYAPWLEKAVEHQIFDALLVFNDDIRLNKKALE
jgi:hypothetical protein